VMSNMEITGYITAFHAKLLAHSSFVTFSYFLGMYTLVIEPPKWLQAPNAISRALRRPPGYLRTKSFQVPNQPS
jgi:hypothetical protein